MLELFFHEKLKKLGVFGAIIELVRPWTSISIALVSIMFYAFAYNKLDFYVIIYFFIFYAFLFGFGVILNDLSDIEVDKKNMPFRPLQKGIITKKQALLLAISCLIISFLLVLLEITFLNASFLQIYLFSFYVLVEILYSVKPFDFSKRTVLGPLTLIIAYALLPAIMGITFHESLLFARKMLIEALISFSLFFSGFILLKDFKDIKGDKEHNKKTFLTIFGEQSTLKLIAGSIIVFFPLFSFYSSFLVSNKLLFAITAAITFYYFIKMLVFQTPDYKVLFDKARIYIMLFFVFTIISSIF